MLKVDIRSLVCTYAARNLSIRAILSIFSFSLLNDSLVMLYDFTCLRDFILSNRIVAIL